MSGAVNYFSLTEMACKDGTPYPPGWSARWEPLLATLNTIREAWGGPIVIISGYRTPEYNRKVGGARKSQHMEGTAADIRPGGKYPPVAIFRLHTLILELYEDRKLWHLGGLGEYPDFVHVDTRHGKRLARWFGSRSNDG